MIYKNYYSMGCPKLPIVSGCPTKKNGGGGGLNCEEASAHVKACSSGISWPKVSVYNKM